MGPIWHPDKLGRGNVPYIKALGLVFSDKNVMKLSLYKTMKNMSHLPPGPYYGLNKLGREPQLPCTGPMETCKRRDVKQTW